MRYLDKVEIESPKHWDVTCMREGCGTSVPHGDVWHVTLVYRHLDNYWQVERQTGMCCSRECAEAVARAFGADTEDIKVTDWDAISEKIERETRALLGESGK